MYAIATHCSIHTRRFAESWWPSTFWIKQSKTSWRHQSSWNKTCVEACLNVKYEISASFWDDDGIVFTLHLKVVLDSPLETSSSWRIILLNWIEYWMNRYKICTKVIPTLKSGTLRLLRVGKFVERNMQNFIRQWGLKTVLRLFEKNSRLFMKWNLASKLSFDGGFPE